MKKLRKVAAVVFILCFTLGLSVLAYGDPVFHEIATEQVEDIGVVPGTYANSRPMSGDIFEEYYKITLPTPSFLCISGEVIKVEKSWGIDWWISQSPDMANAVKLYHYYDEDRNSKNYIGLEAGTYYMQAKDSLWTRTKAGESTFNFSIFSQSVSRTTNTLENSKSTAPEILNGATVELVGTHFNPQTMAKFTVPSQASVTITGEYIVPSGVKGDCDLYIIDAKGKRLGRLDTGSSSTEKSTTLNLKKGTYYIQAQFDSSMNNIVGRAGVTIQYKATLDKPVLKKYKAKTKQIVGTAKQGSQVVVKVNKKTYKANVVNGKFTVKLKKKLKKGDKITVYVLDNEKNKSKTVTKKVK